MNHLREGEQVFARVAGFLPGHRVVLDLEGETVLAASDLPLVRGRLIAARVERSGGVLRLRVVAEAEPERPLDLAAAAPPAGASPDGLDRAIARHAREWGIPITRSFLDRVRREVARADRDLAKGAVIPLERLGGEAARVVAALARGLDPTSRSLAALGADGEARLGIALDRLDRSLGEAAANLGGSGGREAAEMAARLRGFFIDLDEAPVAEAIARGIRLCGYAYEEKLAARGASGWDDPPAGTEENDQDLKGFLLLLLRRLARMRDGGLPREKRDETRRALERALAWSARALDRIEAFQVGNLPGPDGSRYAAEYQLPVLARGVRGTLHLFFSGERTRCWLDMGDGEPLGLDVHGGGKHPLLTVFPAEPEDSSPETAERLKERVAHDAPGATVRFGSRNGASPDHPARVERDEIHPVDLNI
ncbi:MAG: hypothetical protein JW958_11330 [Candidatus Eisenbacteria bacterium]|nr:hypothetical protein [Candidatus Eisenbacteria bacterium]